jgi:hypothetical protein
MHVPWGITWIQSTRKKPARWLEPALRQIGARASTNAVCINQSCKDEKTHQVNLMTEMYQQVYIVIAWLGPADKSSDTVVDYLNEIGGEAQACGLENGHEIYQQIWQDTALNPVTNSSHIAGEITF